MTIIYSDFLQKYCVLKRLSCMMSFILPNLEKTLGKKFDEKYSHKFKGP